MKKLQVGIIGLGKFGLTLGEALGNMGHVVVGVDRDIAKVNQAQEKLAKADQADATDTAALRQLYFNELDKVVVCVGESLESAVLVILSLQELKAKEI